MKNISTREIRKQTGDNNQLSMCVVRYISGLIIRGKLRPGDQLPPEREFAREMRISRPTLREGIGSLMAMGVVKRCHGTGNFVSTGLTGFNNNLLACHGTLTRPIHDQLLEARLKIEVSVAGLAAERATGAQITELAEELVEMHGSLTDYDEYLTHEICFQRIIGRSANNPVLEMMMETLTTNFYDCRSRRVYQFCGLVESANVYRGIYRAIRSHDPVQARQFMEKHLKLEHAALMGYPALQKVSVKRVRDLHEWGKQDIGDGIGVCLDGLAETDLIRQNCSPR